MTVLWSPNSRKEIEKLGKEIQNKIIDKVEEFDERERGDIKKIAEGLWRLRVGDYRVYYHKKEGDIYVLRVIHRKHAYREDIISALREGIDRF